MYIEELEISHYRNYPKELLRFSPKVNIILGENAQGKTNLIESIHVLALARSHRTTNDKDFIQWDQDFAKISALVRKEENTIPLKIIIHKKGKKVSIGKSEQIKLSQYIGQLNVVLFAPEDLNLIKGSPSLRRRFIDIELGQIKPLYLYHLSQYQKVLKQRNTYLKEKKIDQVYLDILTETLFKHGAFLLYERIKFVKKIEKIAHEINNLISQNEDQLRIYYDSKINYSINDTVDNLYEKYISQYQSGKNRELEQSTTLFGPHRDDLIFFVNNRDVQAFGSQGQQRTVVLSLKLAEIDLMKEITGHYPILLLDDVLSELDDYRQTFLLKSIKSKVQTFITTTNIDGIHQHLIDKPKIFKIKEGKVTSDE